MSERWRKIPGFDVYEVSSYGNVRRLYETTPIRVVKPQRNRYGYLVVCLCIDNYKKTKTVHRLVALAFFGASNLDVNHKDGDKENNEIENLEYMTPAANSKHAGNIGLMRRGNDHPTSILTNGAVRRIRRLVVAGTRQADLAREYDVTKAAIGHVVKRKLWKHVKPFARIIRKTASVGLLP